MTNDFVSIEILSPQESKKVSVKSGTKTMQLAEIYQGNYDCKILGAVFNNELCDLEKELNEDGVLEFITIKDQDGYLFYLRSIFFVLIKAAKEIFPHAILHIEYSVGNGYYCWFEGLAWMEAAEVEKLSNRMKTIVDSNFPFVRKLIPTQEAIELFKKHDLFDKVRLFKNRTQPFTNIYTLDSTVGYFSGYLAPSTSYCDKFQITYHNNGIILVIPTPENPFFVPAFNESPKYFNIIKEHKRWLDVLEMDNCAKLNDLIDDDKSKNIILICEALHEKKLAKIADEVFRRRKVVKIVSIAGPSSSGKTTTANRLAIQLLVNGLNPFLISLDDYFLDRDATPLDENGEHDFESIAAINVKLFNENLNDLMRGREAILPRYDFKNGKSLKEGRRFVLPDNGVIIVEGIHGLNPNLYLNVPDFNIYKIYVSALTALNIDNHNRISTTDSRLIRRIARDFKYRGHDSLETLQMWPSVKKGEEKNIFPYQENADIMFNSTLVYEFSALKKYATPLLLKISKKEPEYREAKRLMRFLSFFKDMDDSTIPPNSILREFIGGSVFR